MRLVYLGTPDAAVKPLRALVEAGHDVVLVVSQPDRKRGRGGTLTPSPVKQAGLQLGLNVTDRLDDVLEAKAQLGVVVAFGRLIKPVHLRQMPYVNIHFSLLPRWRGAAPVERALLAGDPTTGCCLMQLEEGLDTGPVFRREETAIGEFETADALRSRLVDIGARMLVSALSNGFESLGHPVAQVGTPVHAAKLRSDEFEIDWSDDAQTISRVVRLEHAWTVFRGKRLKVLAGKPLRGDVESTDVAHGTIGELNGLVVTCGSGRYELVTVQPEGKGAMPAQAWNNGAKPTENEQLGQRQ